MWPWPKPGPVAEQTIDLAGRLRAEPGRVDELLDGLLALARVRHGVLPGRAVLSLGARLRRIIEVSAFAFKKSTWRNQRPRPRRLSRQSTPHCRGPMA